MVVVVRCSVLGNAIGPQLVVQSMVVAIWSIGIGAGAAALAVFGIW